MCISPMTIQPWIGKPKIHKYKALSLAIGPKGSIQGLSLCPVHNPSGLNIVVSDFSHPRAFFHQVSSAWGLVSSPPPSSPQPKTDESWCINPSAPSPLGFGNFQAHLLNPCSKMGLYLSYAHLHHALFIHCLLFPVSLPFSSSSVSWGQPHPPQPQNALYSNPYIRI